MSAKRIETKIANTLNIWGALLILNPNTDCNVYFFSSKEGVWSNEGCMRTGGNLSYSICVCNHLTNFAILMQVVPVEVSTSQYTNVDFLFCQ